ncbi:hypothetical protein PV11_08863 [Exophiala sideris]|uniref:Uncharacterized protein n=1 Tax=Exophiala sideris TaxID=1016849 RepID=A0A0D1VM50_9EURO|nr:hypothetical protein PV11_08863 [Exophiala sideris]
MAYPPARKLQIDLIKAVNNKQDAKLEGLLKVDHFKERIDDSDLRTLLAKAITVGYSNGVRLLLEAGANPNGDPGKGPLHRTIANPYDKTRNDIITLLLSNGCEIEARDDDGRTPLMVACHRGRNDVIRTVLACGADPNAEDNSGKNTLQIMASESNRNMHWTPEVLSLLLSKIKDLNKRDKEGREGRTPLLWAAARGQVALVGALLTPGQRTVDVNQTNDQRHSALHLAARHDEPEIIKLLIQSGARRDAKSDGGWTPLIVAAEAGNERAVDALLTSNANVNARTSSGMSALHWAADNGHLKAVQRIVKEERALKNTKDSFDSTPLVRAAQNGHWPVVDELRPYVLQGPTNPIARKACERFRAAVVNFFEDKEESDGARIKGNRLDALKNGSNKKGSSKTKPTKPGGVKNKVNKHTVWQILYARDAKDPNKFVVPTVTDNMESKKPLFRWIHLPANNISWLEALLTKHYLEGNARDVSTLKSILHILMRQQHRGAKVHSRFMRPSCKRIWVHQGRPSESTYASPERPSSSNRVVTPTTPTPTSKTHPLPTQTPNQPQQEEDVMALFMPYLHYETHENRTLLAQAIREPSGNTHALEESEMSRLDKDLLLIHGYVDASTDLHPRRTLDQFKHHSTGTEYQDSDQVVYRYCKKTKKVPKIFMVDQLWLIIIGDLLITCFPDRWKQPHRDPLNLFEGVVEDINSTTRPPVRNVFELATVITERCIGTFDRLQWDYDELLFAEMFELSIGRLTRKETQLFRRFKDASSLWLRDHEHGNILHDGGTTGNPDAYLLDGSSDEEGQETTFSQRQEHKWHDRHQQADSFVNDLLNIDKEAALLVECKDVEDELDTLTSVLGQQKQVLIHLDAALRASKNVARSQRDRLELYNKVKEQQQLVDLDIVDLERMARQAKSVNDNLTQVLDLKQKHANAVEASLQRKQAQESAKQGRTIMVFTIVTIVFLPLSFLASFFALNVIEFPRPAGSDGGELHLGWVIKYILGIGLAVSVPLIGLAFAIGDIQAWFDRRRRDRYQSRQQAEAAKARALYTQQGGFGQGYDVAEKRTPNTSCTKSLLRRRGGQTSRDTEIGLPQPDESYSSNIDVSRQQKQPKLQQQRTNTQLAALHTFARPQVPNGRPPMSSMDSTGQVPRRLVRVGTRGTVQSDETDDLEGARGFGM